MVDIATRVYNHNWKIDPIVRSLIDTDFYKLLMCQFIYRNWPDTRVTFRLINRTRSVRLADMIDKAELCEQLDHIRTLKLSRGESTWLRGNTFYGKRHMFHSEFMAWFEELRLPPYHLDIRDGQFELRFEASWAESMLWEIPALAVLTELRSRTVLRSMDRFELQVLYARAMTRLWEKIERLRRVDSLEVADFGTRRRHSFLWQDWCVQAMIEGLGRKFVGTSNCLIAMRRCDCWLSRFARRWLRRSAEHRAWTCSRIGGRACATLTLTLRRRRTPRCRTLRYRRTPRRRRCGMQDIEAQEVEMQEVEVDEGENRSPLVSTSWLAEHLDDADVRVVDCRWYLRPFDQRNGDDEYRKAHIPGAVHARWDTELADPERPDLWMLAGSQRFAEAMSRRGIGDDTFVVAYDDQHVTVAARLWWALRVYGHTAVAVLDGGIVKWQAEGRQVSAQVPQYPPACFTPRFNPALYATHDDVLAAHGSDIRLVDGRMAGARAEDGGQIPGSITAPGITFTGAGGTWAGATEAQRRLLVAGAQLGEPTIAYCRGGVGACGTALAYAIAGQEDVAVYDGSWTEWSADPDAPRDLD